jgi:DNA-binding GntR family transcriptional regulator
LAALLGLAVVGVVAIAGPVGEVEATIAEHLEIVRAVIAGEADVAASFMRAHIQRSSNVVRERIGAALARMFEEPAAAADSG